MPSERKKTWLVAPGSASKSVCVNSSTAAEKFVLFPMFLPATTGRPDAAAFRAASSEARVVKAFPPLRLTAFDANTVTKISAFGSASKMSAATAFTAFSWVCSSLLLMLPEKSRMKPVWNEGDWTVATKVSPLPNGVSSSTLIATVPLAVSPSASVTTYPKVNC